MSNPGVGARFSAPVQTRPVAQPVSCTIGTGSFLTAKCPGRGVDHPLLRSAEVKERVELHLNSPSWPSLRVLGRTLSYTCTLHFIFYVLLSKCCVGPVAQSV